MRLSNIWWPQSWGCRGPIIWVLPAGPQPGSFGKTPGKTPSCPWQRKGIGVIVKHSQSLHNKGQLFGEELDNWTALLSNPLQLPKVYAQGNRLGTWKLWKVIKGRWQKLPWKKVH